MAQESPPAAVGGRDRRGTYGKHGPAAVRSDQADAQTTAPVRHVLQRTMQTHGPRRTASGRTAFLVLRILPALARHSGCRRSGFDSESTEGAVGLGPRHDCLLAGRSWAARHTRPEDEKDTKAEQDRGREDDHRASSQWVERPIEKEAKPVDHRTAPTLAPPTPGGWA
jgi:hypothetical protein